MYAYAYVQTFVNLKQSKVTLSTMYIFLVGSTVNIIINVHNENSTNNIYIYVYI